MRKQFIQTLKQILRTDDKSVLLLGDIGVFGFRDELKDIPERTYNIGILEQCTVGVAAGLSKAGLIPFVHTIAPFLVERSYEQLKIDFGYQNLNGNFISVGASYDYAALGCTHHCPGDVSILSNIPNMQILIPGTSREFNTLLTSTYNNNAPTYTRLSEYENVESCDVSFGKANVIKRGSDATVVCFGNMLSTVVKACADLNVTILYYTTVIPFDIDALIGNFNEKIIVCEQFYQGSINHAIIEGLQAFRYTIFNIGIPRQFLLNYGTKEQHDSKLGLDVVGLKNKIITCLKN
jgi:transketolase